MKKHCAELVSALSRETQISCEKPKHTAVSWVENKDDSYQLRSSPKVIEEVMRYCRGFFLSVSSTPNRRLSAFKIPNNIEKLVMKLLPDAVPIPNSYLTLASIEASESHYYIRFKNNSLYDVTAVCGDDVTIHVSPVAGPPEYLALARLLRNATVARWGKYGGVGFHAAAVDIDGKATLLLGEKLAGKTTILCELLGNSSVRFMSNDRVVVMPNGLVRGLPVSVNIRAATVKLYRQLSRMADSGVVNHHRIGMMCESDDISLSVTEFVEALGVGISAEKMISLIVLIKRDETVNGIVLRHEVDLDTRQLIAQNRLDLFDYSQPYWPRNESSGNHPIDMLGQVRVSLVSLTVGNDRISEAAQAILSQAKTVES